MSDNKDFNLDDILNEFQDGPQGDTEELSADLDDLLGDWLTESPEKSQELPADDVPMDTIRLNELIAGMVEQTETEAVSPSEEATIRMDAVSEDATIRMDAVSDDATIRMDAVSEDATIRMDAVSDEATIRMDAVSDEATIRMDAVSDEATIRMDIPAEEAPQEDAPVSAAAPRILYNPRTRLRELKRKLVAGPEKRYYELSETGVVKLQVAILANLILVVLCGLVTTLYALNLLPESRLRFVIFTQILSVLLSAFFGSSQIVEGLSDLFKGRFSIRTMLFVTFIACCVDGVFCLSELRIPCCAAFSLEMTMAIWAQYQRHSTEMAQMDTLRKAVRLIALVKNPVYYDGKPGILRREGEVEDFMDHYDAPSGPEILQRIYCLISLLLCIAVSVFAGMLHGVSLAVQVLSTSLLVAIPATYFIALTRPAALLERRLHMVGSVLCGWRGVKQLQGKAAFPLEDDDLFPGGTTKLNGVKFYGSKNPDDVVAYSTSLIQISGSGLAPLFRNLLESRNGREYPVTSFRDYGSGGIGGEINGESILLGTLDFLQDMGVEIPEGTMVNQAVYAAIDGQLVAVYAISYAKMRSAAAGIISLCGNRKISPVLTGSNFMLTEGLLRAKFSVNTRRISFPGTEEREALVQIEADDSAPSLVLATRNDLAAYAYAVSGARALNLACKLGTVLHLVGGILGILIMAVLSYLGSTDLLTPTHVLLYQLVWLIPGILITEWTRSV